MSCKHGLHESACEQCAAEEDAFERGFKAGQEAQPATATMDLTTLQRYEESCGEGGGVYPDAKGPFVRLADVQALATTAQDDRKYTLVRYEQEETAALHRDGYLIADIWCLKAAEEILSLLNARASLPVVAVPKEVTSALAAYNEKTTDSKAHAFVCIVEDWLDILANKEPI